VFTVKIYRRNGDLSIHEVGEVDVCDEPAQRTITFPLPSPGISAGPVPPIIMRADDPSPDAVVRVIVETALGKTSQILGIPSGK